MRIYVAEQQYHTLTLPITTLRIMYIMLNRIYEYIRLNGHYFVSVN